MQKQVEFRQQFAQLLDGNVQTDTVCKITMAVQNLSKKITAKKTNKLLLSSNYNSYVFFFSFSFLFNRVRIDLLSMNSLM